LPRQAVSKVEMIRFSYFSSDIPPTEHRSRVLTLISMPRPVQVLSLYARPKCLKPEIL
jgi:hypothetical protein